MTAPGQGTTNYSYSTAGRLASRTDSKSHTTSYIYDLDGRLTKQTDPLGRFTTYAYDPAGNPTVIVDAKANAAANPTLGTTAITYDRLNRPTLKDFSDTTPDISYSYDTIGRLSTLTDGAGIETYGYDTAGRVTNVTRGATGFTYGYDSGGNVTSRIYPDGMAYSGSSELCPSRDSRRGFGASTHNSGQNRRLRL